MPAKLPAKLPVDPQYVAPDYLQPGFPVLSFLYALYTDGPFSKNEHAKWLNAWVDAAGPDGVLPPCSPYFGYLDKYDTPSGTFPAEVRQTIGIGVPGNGANSGGLYYPTPAQARVGIGWILTEISNPPAAQPRSSAQHRSVAQLANDRPVLRILAMLFLNAQDDPGTANVQAMIDAAVPDAAVAAVLEKFLANRRAALLDEEKETLTLALVDEFIAAPAKW